ncbi:type II secretion system F family protein [Flavobacteriaceae bacterium MHTCC 0001]
MAFNLDKVSNKERTLKQDAPKKAALLKKEVTLFNKPFSNKVKEDFFTELGVLLKAGITLKDALELLENSQKKSQNKAVLKHIFDKLIEGESLSDTLNESKHFTDYEYFSVKIGEETGTLHQVAEQLGQFFTRKNEQYRNLVSALTYPVIILTTAVLVVVFMLRYVVPMFQDIFKQQNIDLPGITKFIIKLSEFTKDYGLLCFLVITSLFLLRPIYNKNSRIKAFKDKFILKLPFIGSFVKNVYMSQFTQAVALLMASKVPVVNSIQMVKKMIDFYPLQSALEGVENNILKGESLSESLSRYKLFDAKMIALVRVAEETNQTEFIFERLNIRYNTTVQQQSKMLSTVMEPFIILIVGIFVAVILVAMYLPMFKLSSAIG